MVKLLSFQRSLKNKSDRMCNDTTALELSTLLLLSHNWNFKSDLTLKNSKSKTVLVSPLPQKVEIIDRIITFDLADFVSVHGPGDVACSYPFLQRSFRSCWLYTCTVEPRCVRACGAGGCADAWTAYYKQNKWLSDTCELHSPSNAPSTECNARPRRQLHRRENRITWETCVICWLNKSLAELDWFRFKWIVTSSTEL